MNCHVMFVNNKKHVVINNTHGIQKHHQRHCLLSLLPPSFALPLLAEAKFPEAETNW